MHHTRRLIVLSLFAAILLVNVPFPIRAQEPPAMPLAEPGPYGVGEIRPTFVDDRRDGRALRTPIWYPADAGPGSLVRPQTGAAPDRSAAPYPLIFFSHALWDSPYNTLSLGPYLASHGYVVASIEHELPETWGQPDFSTSIVDRPLDILFVLEQIGAFTDADLSGMIDTDNSGVLGYNYGGMAALFVSGAQIDPEYLHAWCAENQPGVGPNTALSVSPCRIFVARWDALRAYRAEFGPLEEGELWPPMSDGRVRAALALAPCIDQLYSETGAAASRVPTLIVFPEDDDICGDSASVIYERLGSPERYLITLLGANHVAALDDSSLWPTLRQVTIAFFGYYLQGRDEYAQYLSEDYITSLPGVSWESTVE